jgi:hypothetical protein
MSRAVRCEPTANADPAGMPRSPPPGIPAPKALAAVKAGPPAEPVDKQRRISARLRRAISLMATGECKQQKHAAERVGMHPDSLSRALSQPHVVEHMRQRALRTIQMGAARAAEVKTELLDCGDSIARDKASTFILATAGIGPATGPALNLNIELKAGYVIDISPDPRQGPPMRIVSPTKPAAIDNDDQSDDQPAPAILTP